jgi:hypothetical protein
VGGGTWGVRVEEHGAGKRTLADDTNRIEQVMRRIGKFFKKVPPRRRCQNNQELTYALWKWVKNTEHDFKRRGVRAGESGATRGMQDAGRPYWMLQSTIDYVDEQRKKLAKGVDGSRVKLGEDTHGWLCRIGETMKEALDALDELVGMMGEAANLINKASVNLLGSDHDAALRDVSIVAKFPAWVHAPPPPPPPLRQPPVPPPPSRRQPTCHSVPCWRVMSW